MSVPGVSVITATTFTSAIGDIHRFRSPGLLVGYLGLDPKVRQSGSEPAHHGRISKAGPSAVRHTLTEAALITISAPGPMRASPSACAPAAGIRSRRSRSPANSPSCSGICSPAARTTPAEARPSLRRRSARWSSRAGAPSRKGHRNPNPTGLSAPERRNHERPHAELAYKRLVTDRQRTGKRTATTCFHPCQLTPTRMRAIAWNPLPPS